MSSKSFGCDASPPRVKTPPVLRLALKGEYFDAIKRGEKGEEYRLRNQYWTKRIEGREFSAVWLSHGYPKHNDPIRWLRRPWKGYTVRTILHPHFGHKPVEVFAIKVN